MRRLLTAMLVGLLFVAACGGDDDDTGGDDDASQEESTDGDGAPAPEVSASVGDDGLLEQAECVGENVGAEDDGVTEDTINAAIISIDFAPLAELGFAASDQDLAATFGTFVDEINDNGGVCGRTIDFQEIKFDIIAGDAGQACVEAIEDRENVVVMTQTYSENLCITDAGVPVVGMNDVTTETMGETDGLMFTEAPPLDDQYEATVQYAAEDGALDGKVGVWYGSIFPDENATVEEVVLPMLDDMGVDYIDFATSFAGPQDPEGNSILTAAATEFAAAEIDTLLQFVQTTNQVGMQTELDAQGVNPRFISMPIGVNSANELFAERFGTTEIADGQQWLTYTRSPTESSPDSLGAEPCHEIWTRRTGETVEPGTFDYNVVISQCMRAHQLAAALSIAGGDLNRESVVTGYANLPPHSISNRIGEIEWSSDNRFGPSEFGVLTYDGSNNTSTIGDERYTVE